MRTVVKGKLFATDLLTAETTKLVENASRDVYIAFANDLARICYHLGVDVHEVISLANTHPRVKILKPGPGVGGPCLTKDPYLLLEGLGERRGEEGLMIVTARSVNSGMTNAVLELAKADGGLRPGSKVVVLGTSYKPEVADPRSSPSEQVIKSLLQMGCKVSAYDPYCKEGFGAEIAENLAAATLNASCAIILVAHHSFQDLKLDELVSNMAPDPLIVDAAGTSRPRDAKSGKYRLRRLGDGKNSRMGTS
jgi:UDP-N-acetyl-D-mannosaminuronic acid dehydrogenase